MCDRSKLSRRDEGPSALSWTDLSEERVDEDLFVELSSICRILAAKGFSSAKVLSELDSLDRLLDQTSVGGGDRTAGRAASVEGVAELRLCDSSWLTIESSLIPPCCWGVRSP